MRFRKKKEDPQIDQDAAERAQYRGNLSRQPLEAILEVPGAYPVEAHVVDLTVQGVGVCVPFKRDPGLRVDEVLEIMIHGPGKAWEVRTPVRVVRIDVGDDVRIGLRFVNLGSLYGQLDNALGTYFNRRARPRAQPEPDRPFPVYLSHNGHRVRADVHDISTSGIGVFLGRVSAGPLRPGERVEVRFFLPGSKVEMVGSAYVRHRTALARIDMVGLEFDLHEAGGFVDFLAGIESYVEQRNRATAVWLSGGWVA